MPLHHLHVAPADVSGAGLRLALNAPAPPALAECTVRHPAGADLTLGVLGASHVISVAGFTEQVSCSRLDASSALPETAHAPGYRLASAIGTHDETAFRRIAADLRERCEHHPGWLGGSFPGDEAALTALWAEPDDAGWRWQTWHLYPGDGGAAAGGGGTVVHTASRWQP